MNSPAFFACWISQWNRGTLFRGWVTSLHGGWHQVFEPRGQSRYLIVLIALLGGAVFIAGLVVARTVAAGAEPGFGKALGIAIGLVAWPLGSRSG